MAPRTLEIITARRAAEINTVLSAPVRSTNAEAHVNQAAWLAQRATLAIALMVGFYLLVLAVIFGLLWIPYAEWTYIDRLDPKAAFVCVVTAFAILVAVFPRPDRFVPPGPRLDERSHRDLFGAIREIAAAAKQEMPTDVYLVNEVNAWVTHRGGTMGFGSHRVMGIGLPLLQGLTVSEFKAVLAHEFGHYAAGDVTLGPWIYKTRVAIERALALLEESWLLDLFNWYGHMFLRLTHAVSRQQEFLADALAARTVHPVVMASALRRTATLAPAFDNYWQFEVAPALNAGCLPPITAGFDCYLSSERIASAVNQLVSSEEARDETDAFDTHPPLRERLAALSAAETLNAVPSMDPPAATLLPDIEAHAQKLLEFAVGSFACSQLKKVDWSELGMVYAEQWRELAAQNNTFLHNYTADGLPTGHDAFKKAGSQLMAGDAELRIARVCGTFSVAVAVALLDTGAVPETMPGRPLVFRKGRATMEPFVAIQQLAEGTLTSEDWQTQCQAMGIVGRSLSPGDAGTVFRPFTVMSIVTHSN